MRVVAVLLLSILVGFWAHEYRQGSTDKCSGLPVTYTTGYSEQDAILYQSEGWEIIDITPIFNHAQVQEGWIALVDIFGEDDPRIDTLTTDEQDRSQIYRDGEWQLQSEFEKFVCSLPREYR